ncbi:MAG: hypothetical protein R3E14_10465 [Erythrobacter sp.]
MVARDVLDTPPIVAREDGLVLFSMIGTRVLLPYLVAVKSLQHHLGGGRIVILDDGTLTASDKAILAYHCDNPPIVAIASVDTGPCPRGGTWERLLTILDIRAKDYVIQLDSDTVTLGPVTEIAQVIREGRSFTLRGEESAQIRSLKEAADQHLGNHSTHVQATIEAHMDRLDMEGRENLKYVRGCSGFAGFAPNPDGRGLAERFSVAAEQLLGKAKWAEWGSEQVTSNFVVANADDPLLLPYDRYLNHWNAPVPAAASFAHFIGTYRYTGGEYARATKAAIAALKG